LFFSGIGGTKKITGMANLRSNAGNLTKDQLNQLQEETKNLYKDLENYIIQLQENFVKILQTEIEGLKDYSAARSNDLFTFFNEQLEGTSGQVSGITGFRVWVHEKRDYIISKYYTILTQINPNFKYDSGLSSYEQNFIQGVHDVTNESIVLAQALVLDLSADVKNQKLSFDISQGFFESELHAQMLYEEQFKKNQEKMSKRVWDDLRQFGSDFCESFLHHAGIAITKEVSKKISNIGAKSVAKKGEQAVVDSAVIEKIENLSQELPQDNINDLQENKLSDASVVLLRKAIKAKKGLMLAGPDPVVNTTVKLSSHETMYLTNRHRKIQPILEKEFGIDTPLRIAMCCSGGGNRAMIGTLGFFTAAAKHNILQVTTYIVGLSGSTWTIAPWVYLNSKGYLGSKDYIKSLGVLKDSFIASLSGEGMLSFPNGAYTPPILGQDAAAVLSNQLMDRFGFEQNISLVDLWGALVGNYALSLSKKPFKLESCWSEIAGVVVNADFPMPLCSAAFDARADVSDSAQKDVGSEYDWLETGPFEAGSTILGYVPIKYFGSRFAGGKLEKELVSPEYPMSFYLGVYGSAFSLTINDLIEKGLKNPTVDVLGVPVTVPVASWVKEIAINKTDAETTSKRHAKIHAQLYNFSNDQNSSVLKNKYIGLFDGGIAFNIPLPLVIDRKDRAVDIVFMYDSNPGDFDTLKSADKYFARKGIKLPSFSAGLRKADLTKGEFPWRVYNDPRDKRNYDVTQPTFIYFPTKVDVSNPPFATSNFRYTKDNVKDLMYVVEDNFEFHLDEIKEIMQKVAKARSPKSHSASLDQDLKKLKSLGGNVSNSNVIEGIHGESGKYFPDNVPSSAYLIDQEGNKVEYTNIIEYSQPVTPPGKRYTLFAKMPNPKYNSKTKKLAGGQLEYISLYGQLKK